MAEPSSNAGNGSIGMDEAIWMQRGPSESAKTNPFVPSQAVSPQAASGPAADAGSQQKKP